MAYMQIANSRGGRALILNSFRYLRNKSRADVVYWGCAQRGCNVYLKTNAFDMEGDDNDIVIVSGPGPHGHAAEAELVATTALTCNGGC